MAQGDSIVGICNAALIALGEDPVTSVFPPDPTKRAILCNARYDQVRREVLRSAPWACAKEMALLAANATPPKFKWANAFPVPADYIRPWEIEGAGDASTTTWEVAGGQILTDEGAPLQFEYIRDLRDPGRFDPLLVRCLYLALAIDMCDALTQSEAKQQRLARELAAAQSMGQLVDSQGDGPQETDDDVWLRSRR